MTFNGEQMAALLKAAKLMALADGRMTNDEKNVMKADWTSFGIKLDTAQSIALESASDNMEPAEMLGVIANMNIEQKKYACGYLAAVMAADGNIDESEVKVWTLISALCKFPTMSAAEAIQYWTNH